MRSLCKVSGVELSEALFGAVVEGMRALAVPDHVLVSEAPPPRRLAPHAHAITAEVDLDDEIVADGRLVMLHDPDGQAAWHGQWRFVLFARATLETEMAQDPLLADVGWSWLQESLADYDVVLTAFGGTVTQTTSTSYGAISDRPVEGQLEIRASWTAVVEPADDAAATALIGHAGAWLDLLSVMAGIPPQAPGVTRIGPR